MLVTCDRCGKATHRFAQHASGMRCYAASVLKSLWECGFVPYFYDTDMRVLARSVELVLSVDFSRARKRGAKSGYFVKNPLAYGRIADRIARDRAQIETSLSRGKSWYQITREV